MTTTTTVHVGTRFHSAHADSNPLWEVTAVRGPDAWEAVVVEDADYDGAIGLFDTSRIRQSLDRADFFARKAEVNESFWERQEVGTTLHYDQGFQRYVRGVVAEQPDGTKGLRRTAIVDPHSDGSVGSWRKWEWQPSYWDDGTPRFPLTTQKVLAGDMFRPHCTTIYEWRRDNGTLEIGSVDPATFLPLDLTLPPTSPTVQAEFDRHRRLDDLKAIIENKSMSAADRLDAVAAAVSTNKNGPA